MKYVVSSGRRIALFYTEPGRAQPERIGIDPGKVVKIKDDVWGRLLAQRNGQGPSALEEYLSSRLLREVTSDDARRIIRTGQVDDVELDLPRHVPRKPDLPQTEAQARVEQAIKDSDPSPDTWTEEVAIKPPPQARV